jgi:hypothetical protein
MSLTRVGTWRWGIYQHLEGVWRGSRGAGSGESRAPRCCLSPRRGVGIWAQRPNSYHAGHTQQPIICNFAHQWRGSLCACELAAGAHLNNWLLKDRSSAQPTQLVAPCSRCSAERCSQQATSCRVHQMLTCCAARLVPPVTRTWPSGCMSTTQQEAAESAGAAVTPPQGGGSSFGCLHPWPCRPALLSLCSPSQQSGSAQQHAPPPQTHCRRPTHCGPVCAAAPAWLLVRSASKRIQLLSICCCQVRSALLAL